MASANGVWHSRHLVEIRVFFFFSFSFFYLHQDHCIRSVLSIFFWLRCVTTKSILWGLDVERECGIYVAIYVASNVNLFEQRDE